MLQFFCAVSFYAWYRTKSILQGTKIKLLFAKELQKLNRHKNPIDFCKAQKPELISASNNTNQVGF